MVTNPTVGVKYRAIDLPPGSVVSTGISEYVKAPHGDCLMRWEQPIPGSGDWLVTYAGKLPPGIWMTDREIAEVHAATGRRYYVQTPVDVRFGPRFTAQEAYAMLALLELAEEKMLKPGVSSDIGTVARLLSQALMRELSGFDETDQAILDNYRAGLEGELR